MKRPRSLLLATVLFAASSSAALAAMPSGWDGTCGAWGGNPNQATSITIAGNRVVSYTYQGMSHPVPGPSNVTSSMVTYQVEGNTVRLIRRSDTTANAALYTQMGDGTAVLTRR